MKKPPEFPAPHVSDSDDVAWALCTAAALWKTNKFAEAVKWMQKAAAEAAAAVSGSPDSNVRVVQLTIAATELAHYVDEWKKGEDADPASIAISLDFDTASIDVETVPPIEVPKPSPPKPAPPKVAPRAKTFAATLPQDARSPVVPAPPNIETKIQEKKPLGPRGGAFAGTLGEAMSSPLARRPSSAGPLGQKPKPPEQPLELADTSKLDPFAGLDDPRLSSKLAMPAQGSEPAVTKRMDDVPTRRIAEGEAWPPTDIDESSKK